MSEARNELEFYLRGALVAYDEAAVRRILDGVAPYIDRLARAGRAGLFPERLAEAWWVGIQHRNGLTEEQALARWNDQDPDTLHMRGVYLDVAQQAFAHLRRAAPPSKPVIGEVGEK